MIDPVFFRGLWREMIPAVDRGACVFKDQTTSGVYTDVAISDFWFRQGGIEEAEVSDGAYLVEMILGYIPRELLAAQPLPGDLVASFAAQKSDYPLTGKTFVVGKKGAKAVNAEGVWEMNLHRPFVNPAEAEEIDVYRPQPGITDDGLVDDGTATLIGTNIVAAIQESDTFKVAPIQSQEVYGRLQNPQPVRIFIETTLRVQPKDYVVRASDGRRYTILNDSNVNRVGEFQAFDCILHS